MVSPVHFKKHLNFLILPFLNTTMWWTLLKVSLKNVLTRKWKFVLFFFLLLIVLTIVIDLSGLLRHPFERSFQSEFSYPLELPNFREVVEKYRNRESILIQPINTLYRNVTYVELADEGCGGSEYRLIIVIKSAGANFKKRAAIRATWGNPRRFSDVAMKIVFVLGRVGKPRELTNALDGKLRPVAYTITAESGKYNDMILADFRDTYYNNTLKTMLGIRWLNEYCPNYRFAYFVDDDMYVSVKNLLKFLRNPAEYPDYWEKQKAADEKELQEKRLRAKKKEDTSIIFKTLNAVKNVPAILKQDDSKLIGLKDVGPLPKINIWKNDPMDFDIELSKDVKLFAGNVYNVSPLRHKLDNKWFVSLSEYPYDYYPPYVPAGSMIMSKPVIEDFYYAALFTKPYRFDDVYLGILAKKMGILPFHSEKFEMQRIRSRSLYSEDYKYLIASHDYEPNELKEIWFVQKTLGNT